VMGEGLLKQGLGSGLGHGAMDFPIGAPRVYLRKSTQGDCAESP
jgi:hypothetical protein